MSSIERESKVDGLLLALLETPTIKQAAAKAGMSYATARRLLADPAVQAKLRGMRETALREALDEAVGLARLARETLAEAMAATDAPLSVRVRAAGTALDYAQRVFEMYELAERIDALETRLAATAAATSH